jgi:ribosome-associated protein
MFQINHKLSIPLSEIELSAIRSQGAGGQNVNKVALSVAVVILPRKLTKPSKGQNRRRLDTKKRRSQTKASRKIVE